MTNIGRLIGVKNALSTNFIHCTDMGYPKQSVGTFQKMGECLYRYSSNGVYYARIKTSGKEIRRSLATTDPVLARRNLRKLRDEQQQIDRSKSKITLAELCDRYLRTVQHQRAKTIERKNAYRDSDQTRLAGWFVTPGRKGEAFGRATMVRALQFRSRVTQPAFDLSERDSRNGSRRRHYPPFSSSESEGG
jgi:hypothetical protein